VRLGRRVLPLVVKACKRGYLSHAPSLVLNP
jgi:hypothetical protein